MITRVNHDDATRTVTTYDQSGNVTSTRPYTDTENDAADAAATQAAAQQVAAQLTADTILDMPKIAQAIADLVLALGDETVAGSYRAIMGTSSDPAGTTSLRALRSQTNTDIASAKTIKAVIGFLIDVIQLDRTVAAAERRIARQVARLGRTATGTDTSADVGQDIP